MRFEKYKMLVVVAMGVVLCGAGNPEQMLEVETP